MQVVVDGIIYQNPKCGISRLFSEILPRVCCKDDSLRIKLFTEGRIRQELPKHPHISHLPILPVARYMNAFGVCNSITKTTRNLMLQKYFGSGKEKIWHSTYYSLPKRWYGPKVVSVYDMIIELFKKDVSVSKRDEIVENKRESVLSADAVICISQTTKRDVQQLYNVNDDSIFVIPLACSEAFRPLTEHNVSFGGKEINPFILYIGARNSYKNFHSLIKAYSIWAQRKEVALVTVGRPWLNDERSMLLELGIQERVHLFENIDDVMLCRLYNQAVAFVYPSLYEGFGIPLLESMACGCPIIASCIPSTVEVAGDCPIYFEPTEIDDLINAFDIAVTEGRNYERVRLGLERSRAFSWDQTAAQTLEVYHTIS